MIESNSKIEIILGKKRLSAEEKLTIGKLSGGYDFEIDAEGVGQPHAVVEMTDDGYFLQAYSGDCHLWIEEAGKPKKTNRLALRDGLEFKIEGQKFLCKAPDNVILTPEPEEKPFVQIFKDHDQGLQPFFNEKIYRIGIIGAQNSGKTCFLTALGMSRRPHSGDLTCTQLQKLPTQADGMSISAERKAKLIKDFSNGCKRIKESIKLIFEGEIPDKTSIEILRMVYLLGRGDKPCVRIELIDYAGEIIDKADALDGMPAGKMLLNILNEVDAFLILIESPLPNKTELSFDLAQTEIMERIKQVFLNLDPKSIQRPRPIAILINKWDRCNDLTNITFAEECRKLEGWVTSPSGDTLLQLKQVLSGIAGHPVSLFPVSSFGESEIIETDPSGKRIERPIIRNGLLHSFGLEEVLDNMISEIFDEFCKQANQRIDQWKSEFHSLPKHHTRQSTEDRAKKLQQEVGAFRDEIQKHSGMTGMLTDVMSELENIHSEITKRIKNRKSILKSVRIICSVGIAAVILLALLLTVGGFYKKKTYIDPISESAMTLKEYVNASPPEVPQKRHWEAGKQLTRQYPSYSTIWPLPRDANDEAVRKTLHAKFNQTSFNAIKALIASSPLDPKIADHVHAITVFHSDTGTGTKSAEIDSELKAYWSKLLLIEGENLARKSIPEENNFNAWKEILDKQFPQESKEERFIKLTRQIGDNIDKFKIRERLQKDWINFIKEVKVRNFKGAKAFVGNVLESPHVTPSPGEKDKKSEELKEALLIAVNGTLKAATFGEVQEELEKIKSRFAAHDAWKWLEPKFDLAIQMLSDASKDYNAYASLRQARDRVAAEKYLAAFTNSFMKQEIERWLKGDFEATLEAKLDYRGPVVGINSKVMTIKIDGADHGELKAKAGEWGPVGKRLPAVQDAESIKINYTLKMTTLRRFGDDINNTINSREYNIRVEKLRKTPPTQYLFDGGVKVYLRLQPGKFKRPPPDWDGQYENFPTR